ncbi:MAG: GNAT family protein [Ferruginibacter sp.]
MIRLEYFDRTDFDQLLGWLSTEELLMNWSGALFHFPISKESLEWYIEDVNDLKKSDAFLYKAVDGTGKTVGHISLGNLSRKNKSARISRVMVDPEQQGKGYCCEMVTAVLSIGFEQLNLHRIELGVYDFNKAAIRCYQKAGMIIEGTSRDSLFFKQNWWSLVEMSMLENEWSGMQGK